MSSELQNFVTFKEGVEKWLVLRDPRVITKHIIDPLDKRGKDLKVRRWTVTREDGAFVNKQLDVTSISFDSELMTLWNLGTMDRSELGITVYGEGFAKKYSVTTRPFQV